MLIHLDSVQRTSAWVYEHHGKTADEFLLPFIEMLHAYDDRIDGCLVDADAFAVHYASCAERFAEGRAWVRALLLRRAEALFASDIGELEARLLQHLLLQDAQAVDYDPGHRTVREIIRDGMLDSEADAH